MEESENKGFLGFIKGLGFMEISIIVVLVFFVGIFVWSYSRPDEELQTVSADTTQVRIYEFWGQGCPHCAAAAPFLDSLEEEYEGVELHKYEVYYDVGNQNKQQEVAEALGKGDENLGVPYTIIGDEVFNGFDNADGIGVEMKERIEFCLTNQCSDKTGEVLGFAPLGKTEVESTTTEYMTISNTEAAQRIEENRGSDSFVILDVRTPEEYQEDRITDDALNIDVEDPAFGITIEALDKDKEYLVYCRSGRRSAIAAQTMIEAGFTSIYNMDGGTVQWYNSSL
jgi:rhodanese-related sulfurtransferase/glutaredoxin